MRNTLSSALVLLGLVFGLGVPVYWWITYSGVYRWLAEVQLGWFDGYYAILTGVLSVAVGCVAFIPPFTWLAGRAAAPASSSEQDADDAAATRPEPVLLTAQQVHERAARGKALGCVGALGVLTVPIVVIGAWFLVEASQFGPRHQLDLAALEAGAEPPSRWVDFDARAAWGEAAGIKEKHVVTLYVPVRSAPGRDAAVALEVPARAAPRDRRRWTGTLSEGAPGVVVSAFARDGGVREPVWVLDVDRTPDDVRRIGWSMLEVGGGMLLIGLIIIALLRRRWRRLDA